MTAQVLTGVLAGRDTELRRLFRAGLTSGEIGARLGVAAQTVGDACRRIGLRRGRGWTPPADRFDRIDTPQADDTPQDRLARRLRALRRAGVLRVCEAFDLDLDLKIAICAGAYAALADLAAEIGAPQARLLARWHRMRPHLGGYLGTV